MEKPVPQFQWWDQLPQARLGLDFAIPQEPNSARTQGQNLDHLLNLISPSLSALAHLRSRPVVPATSTSTSSSSSSASASPAPKSPGVIPRNIKPRVAPEGRVQSARLPRQVFDSLTPGSPSSPIAPLVPASSSSSLLSSPDSATSPERKTFGERAAEATSPRGAGSGTWKPVVPPSRQLSAGGIGRRPVPTSRRTMTGGQGFLARATEEASQEARGPESPPSPETPSSPGRSHDPSLSLARSRERVESPLSPGRAKPESPLSPSRSKAFTEAPTPVVPPPAAVEPISPKIVSPLPSPSALPPPPKPIARPRDLPATPSPSPSPASPPASSPAASSPSQPVGRVAPANSAGRVRRRGAARPVSMSMVPLQQLAALAPNQSSSSSSSSSQPPLRTAASDSQVNPLSPRSASQTAIDVAQSVNALQSLLKEIEVEYTEIMTSPHWFNVCDIVSNLRSHFNNLEKAKRSPE